MIDKRSSELLACLVASQSAARLALTSKMPECRNQLARNAASSKPLLSAKQMAEPAPTRDVDAAQGKWVNKQIVISLTTEECERVKDYRFDKRFDSISAAVRHLIEVAMRVEGWQAKKRK